MHISRGDVGDLEFQLGFDRSCWLDTVAKLEARVRLLEAERASLERELEQITQAAEQLQDELVELQGDPEGWNG